MAQWAFSPAPHPPPALPPLALQQEPRPDGVSINADRLCAAFRGAPIHDCEHRHDQRDWRRGDPERELRGNSPYWKELVFLINVRKGFTKRLLM
ncbi:hypothetical protein SCP_0601760 [Sparassis crispa]|uniref:Uncharacterized protein n=1 Tax=Sparassis crispa TaxID=139825 RepID=A0A401GPQ2_9APHY|nr:hypothetical protein SCP_0601760 [Sparassis crispa]GBE84198.1 hypothetical protein SCP_0601760 [Sparassis crispa]